MADQNKDIESLKTKVDKVKDDLADLKKETSEESKKDKAEVISSDTADIKKEIEDLLVELKKDVTKNKDDITKLEELKKSLEEFDKELGDLKLQVEIGKDKKKESKSAPSLRAKIFYGGLIAKGLGSLPLIGDSLKERGEEKVKESAEEKEEEKKEPKEKKGFWGKAWRFVRNTALITGAIILGKKAIDYVTENTKKETKKQTKKEETPSTSDTPVVKKESTEEPVTFLSKEDAIKDLPKNHLVGPDKEGKYEPMDGYTWVDDTDATNFAVKEGEDKTDTFGNTMVSVDDESKIPKQRRSDSIAYYIVYPSGNMKYKFYGNGRYIVYEDMEDAEGRMGNWNNEDDQILLTEDVAMENTGTENTDDGLDDDNIKTEEQVIEATQKLTRAGYSDLYILIRMYELGFIPRTNFEKFKGASLRGKTKWVVEGGRLDKLGTIRGNFKAWLIHTITLSKDEYTRLKLDAIKNSPDIAKIYEGKINELKAMEKDINEGKFKNYKEFKKKYGNDIIKNKGEFKDNAKAKIESKFNTLTEAEKEMKKIDGDIKKLQQEAESKLKELDAKAKADPTKTKELQAESKKMIGEYNKKILELEKQTGIKLSSLTASELTRLSKTSPTVSKIMKINNGIDKYLSTSKVGKLMIGVSVLILLDKGASGVEWKEVGKEAADLGIGLIPFAGGVYDVTTAITGEGIAGDLSKTDRIIRGVVGGVSIVLDVAGLFTFGAGNVASVGLKTLVKGGVKAAEVVKIAVKEEKVASKTVKVAKVVSEVGELGMKLGTYGFLGYSLYETAKPAAVRLYEKGDKARVPDIQVNTK